MCGFSFFPPPAIVNKALIGEGLAEETRPGCHSLFHINTIYNVFQSLRGMFELLSRTVLFVFLSMTLKVESSLKDLIM